MAMGRHSSTGGDSPGLRVNAVQPAAAGEPSLHLDRLSQAWFCLRQHAQGLMDFQALAFECSHPHLGPTILTSGLHRHRSD